MPRIAVFLAIALVSCDQLPRAQQTLPAGPIGAIAQQAIALLAPGADITDTRLEEVLAGADLHTALGSNADTVIAQVRETRSQATAAWKRGSAAGGQRLASVRGAVGEFTVPLFAHTLAESLDQFTKASITQPGRNTPTTSPSNADGFFTTTTINVVDAYSSAGSKVTLSMSWSYTTASIESKTGLTIFTMSDDRTMAGTIDVCPDTAGTVTATLKVEQKVKADTKGKITTSQATSDNTLAGTVGDDASLRSVRQTFHEQRSWEVTSGSGSYDLNMGATYNANQSGAFLGGIQAGSIGGNVASATGQALDASTLGKAAAFSLVVDAFSLEEAFQAAQKLWRNGRCVMVTAPDYSAETPINTNEQEKSQHDEAVDPASETKFSISLKHRFGGGAISAPATANLSGGAKSIAPNRIDSGSGALTYKAPDEEDKKATAKLQSTSKRGIGTLVLDFHTGNAITLSINGELTGNSTRIGTVRTLDILKIGPLEFKKFVGDTWQATGPWTAETSSFTAVAGSTDTCTGRDSGTITLTASTETRAGKKVWVIDPLDATFDGKGSTTCVSSLGDQSLRGVTIPGTRTFDSDGDAAELFLSNLDTFTIPAEGGSVRVHGSSGGAGGSFTSDGTATAKKK